MIRYLIEPSNRLFVKGCGFLCFEKKYGQKYWGKYK